MFSFNLKFFFYIKQIFLIWLIPIFFLFRICWCLTLMTASPPGGRCCTRTSPTSGSRRPPTRQPPTWPPRPRPPPCRREAARRPTPPSPPSQPQPPSLPMRRRGSRLETLAGWPIQGVKLRWVSHSFPIEKASGQDCMHMIARPSINKDIKNRKTMRGTR